MQPTATLASLAREYAELGDTCRGLTDAQWNAPSLCEDWTVRDVLAHIVAADRAVVTGRYLLGVLPNALPGGDVLRANNAAVAAWRSRSTDDLLAAYTHWGALARRMLSTLTPYVWTVKLPTPLGRLRGGSLVGARIYDLWVHHADIAIPLGLAEPAAERAGAAVQWVLDALPGRVGPALQPHRGQTLGIRLTRPVSGAWTWTIGHGDPRPVPRDDLDRADAVLTTDTRTFLLTAAGRERPGAALADGRIAASGDDLLTADFGDAFVVN